MFEQASEIINLMVFILIAIALVAAGIFLMVRAAGRQTDALRMIGEKLDDVAAAAGPQAGTETGAMGTAAGGNAEAADAEGGPDRCDTGADGPAERIHNVGRLPYNVGKSGRMYTKDELEALIRD